MAGPLTDYEERVIELTIKDEADFLRECGFDEAKAAEVRLAEAQKESLVRGGIIGFVLGIIVMAIWMVVAGNGNL